MRTKTIIKERFAGACTRRRIRNKDILLLVLRSELSSHELKRLLGESFVDWDDFFKSVPDRLLPEVAFRVAGPRLTDMGMHPRIGENISRRMQEFARNRLIIEAETVRAIKEFDRSGIAFGMLKGAVLEKEAYSCGLRPFKDIDLLVRAGDLGRAREASMRIGFSPVSDELERYNSDTKHHDVLEKKSPDVILELHRSIVGPTSPAEFREDVLFGNMKKTLVCGVRVKVMDDELLLINSSIHFIYSHPFIDELRVGFEISNLVSHGRIGWHKLLKICRETGSSAMVYEALMIAKRSFDIKAPKRILLLLRKQSSLKEILVIRTTYSISSERWGWNRIMIKWLVMFGLCNSFKKLRIAMEDLMWSFRHRCLGKAV